jgi:hypothetical protein
MQKLYKSSRENNSTMYGLMSYDRRYSRLSKGFVSPLKRAGQIGILARPIPLVKLFFTANNGSSDE